MLIGGCTSEDSYSKATYVYNGQSGKWTKGPDLLQGRFAHSAGTLHDAITHDQYTVVVGGWNRRYLSSVEVLKSGSTEWAQGTPLPIPLIRHQMINWHNNLVVLGGETTGNHLSS